MIRDLLPEDRDIFLSMLTSFYSSNAVSHNVDPKNFETTFAAIMDKSPFLRALIIEDGGVPAGYALLSFTYSNEAGGMVVLIEEVYVNDACRGKGLGSRVLEFIEREYPSARRFRLEVREDNVKAINLYNRFGYEAFDYIQMVKDIWEITDSNRYR